MQIKIIREKSSPCCIGSISIDGENFGVTLERPWLDNQNKISAIPAGNYELDFTWSNRFNRSMLQVLNVPNRGGIRIHAANKVEELEGCIAVASQKKQDNENEIVFSKVPLLEKLAREAILRGEKLHIEIVNGWENVIA